MKKRLLSFVILGLVVALGYGYVCQRTPKIKNIILMIGDGMGPQQLSLMFQYAKDAPHSKYKGRQLYIERMTHDGEVGVMTTVPADGLVIDSAASGTQIATGHWSRLEMVGLNKDGDPVETILEKAKKAGKATGLVSNTRMTHATPSAFAAHQASRTMENEIALDMLSIQPDVMLSGGIRHWLPMEVNQQSSVVHQTLRRRIPTHVRLKSKRKDSRNLLEEAEKLGYELVFSKQALGANRSKKLLGLFSYSIMPDALTMHAHRSDPQYPIPSMKDMTKKALAVLGQHKKGFFLMVESGLIDYAGHFNDAGQMLHELLQFDEAIGVAYEWAKHRRDTLIIVTADHETGSFGFSYSKNNLPEGRPLSGEAFKNRLYQPRFNFGDVTVLDKIYNQKKSFASMLSEFNGFPKAAQTPRKLRALINEASEFKVSLKDVNDILATEKNQYRQPGHAYLSQAREPLVHDFKEFYVYGNENQTALMGRALAKQQQVVWGTGTHTSTPVWVVSYGPKKTLRHFSGLMHSTDLGQRLMSVGGFDFE